MTGFARWWAYSLIATGEDALAGIAWLYRRLTS